MQNSKLMRALALAVPLTLAAAAQPSLAQQQQGRQLYEQPLLKEGMPADPVQHAQQLSAETGTPFIGEGAKGPAVLRAQVLLDRHWFSPGQIDGRYGRNMRHAILAFQEAQGLERSGVVDAQTWAALQKNANGPTFTTYQLSEKDLRGPFGKLPEKPQQQAELEQLHYTSPLEMLAERFHVKPELLADLNKGRQLQAGQTLVVPNVGNEAGLPEGKKTIVISKSDKMLYLRGEDGKLLGAFPVSIGGRGDDLPVGQDLEIQSDVKFPDFRYNASLLKGYDGPDVVVPPGPNSPVGVLWMGLSKPHWGIHGTSEPAQMARVETNGCIRMTNWDAWRLTEHVGIGTVVRLDG